jgi:hypothetical protein
MRDLLGFVVLGEQAAHADERNRGAVEDHLVAP